MPRPNRCGDPDPRPGGEPPARPDRQELERRAAPGSVLVIASPSDGSIAAQLRPSLRDFIASTRLISLFISQGEMSPVLADVFRSLLTGYRSLLLLAAVDRYVQPGVPVTFSTVTEAGRRRGQTALGCSEASGWLGEATKRTKWS